MASHSQLVDFSSSPVEADALAEFSGHRLLSYDEHRHFIEGTAVRHAGLFRPSVPSTLVPCPRPLLDAATGIGAERGRGCERLPW